MVRQENPQVSESDRSSARKLLGLGAILVIIIVWAALVASLAPLVGQWPALVQAPFYLFMGLAWIAPLKPLVRWIETGRWKGPPSGGN